MSKVGKQQLTTDVQTSLVPYVVATGVANAYSVLISGVASYYDGLSFKLKIPVAASAPITVNVNGLGVIPVKKDNGNAVSNWKKDGVYTVVFSGGSFQVLGEGGEYGTASPAEVLSGYTVGLENGVESGTLTLTGNALVGDVLSGKTFYDTDAKVKRTGTMVNRGSIGTQNLTSQNASYTIPQGYHNGVGKVTATYAEGAIISQHPISMNLSFSPSNYGIWSGQDNHTGITIPSGVKQIAFQGSIVSNTYFNGSSGARVTVGLFLQSGGGDSLLISAGDRSSSGSTVFGFLWQKDTGNVEKTSVHGWYGAPPSKNVNNIPGNINTLYGGKQIIARIEVFSDNSGTAQGSINGHLIFIR